MVFYGRLAEVTGEYLRKGRTVFVEGRLKTRKWQDADNGIDRYSTEIIAEQMQMLGGRPDGHTDESKAEPAARSKSRGGKGKEAAAPVEDESSDIPF